MSDSKQHPLLNMAQERAESIKSRHGSKSSLISSDLEFVLGNSQHDRGSKSEMFISRETLQKREQDLSR